MPRKVKPKAKPKSRKPTPPYGRRGKPKGKKAK
jgi:hypothetical protein